MSTPAGPILIYVPLSTGGGFHGHPPPNGTCDDSYHDEIVAILTADGTPSLQQLPTFNLAITCTLITIVIVVDGEPESQQHRLDPFAANPADRGQTVPDDYSSVSNDKHWTKVG